MAAITRPERIGHSVAAIHFPSFRSLLPAWLDCSCGESMEALPDLAAHDPHAPLTAAWLEHRRTVGAPIRPLALGNDHEPVTYGTALGNSRLSPAERGRMGVVEKRRKAALA